MKKMDSDLTWLIVVFFIISIFVCSIIFDKTTKIIGYRQGQIDYANGIIKYELQTNPDKTMEWRERK